jgi:hypothetical protein
MDTTAVWKPETWTPLLQQLDRGGHADLLLLRQSRPPMAKLVCVFNFPFHGENIPFKEYSVKKMNFNYSTP